jgi:hypothetical protein
MNAGSPTKRYRMAAQVGIAWACAAAAALGTVYLVTLTLVNSWPDAVSTFQSLWYWIVPLLAGFALQVGLFAYSRRLARMGVSPHSSGVVASGGASAVSMVACCTHRIADVLPLMGLAGVAMFLSTYQTLFLLAGLLSNLVGIVFLLGEMAKHKLYDPQGVLLAPLLRFPVDRAKYPAAGLAGLVMTAAILLKLMA